VPLLLLFGVVAVLYAGTQVIKQIVQVLIQPTVNLINSTEPNIPLSPPDAADGVIRGRWDQEYGAQQASYSGVGGQTFADMVNLVGEPPPLDRMLALYMRGDLDYSDLETMFEYSRARDEWFAPWVQSFYSTMSSADALEARLKGVIDDPTAQQLFLQAGGLGEQYDWLLSTVGDAIGVVEAGNLFNHGLITADQFQSVILHSRINPQFEAMGEMQRFHWLGVFQIAEALKNGTATPDQATQWLTELGYPADQIAAFVGSASGTAVSSSKSLAESQILTLYEAGGMTVAEATNELAHLGYPESQSQFILSVHAAQSTVKMTNAIVTKVQNDYVKGSTSQQEASQELSELGFSQQSISTYLTLWDIQTATKTKQLSVAQIGTAFKDGIITDTDALAKWSALGYNAEDSAILLAHYGGPPPPGSPAAQTPKAG
jgi:Holliday junction resolvasome RuvABC DNA-binding subunit